MKFSSDYIFLKNASVDTIIIKARDDNRTTYEMLPGSTTAFYFGGELTKKSDGVDIE